MPNNPTTRQQPSKTDKRKSCHQCKMKRLDLAYCTNLTPPTKNRRTTSIRPCRKKYCDKCLRKWYEEVPPGEANKRYAFGQPRKDDPGYWDCPACRGRCSCAACRKREREIEEAPTLLDVKNDIRKKDKSGFFKCLECKETFKTRNHFDQHNNYYHSEKVKKPAPKNPEDINVKSVQRSLTANTRAGNPPPPGEPYLPSPSKKKPRISPGSTRTRRRRTTGGGGSPGSSAASSGKRTRVDVPSGSLSSTSTRSTRVTGSSSGSSSPPSPVLDLSKLPPLPQMTDTSQPNLLQQQFQFSPMPSKALNANNRNFVSTEDSIARNRPRRNRTRIATGPRDTNQQPVKRKCIETDSPTRQTRSSTRQHKTSTTNTLPNTSSTHFDFSFPVTQMSASSSFFSSSPTTFSSSPTMFSSSPTTFSSTPTMFSTSPTTFSSTFSSMPTNNLVSNCVGGSMDLNTFSEDLIPNQSVNSSLVASFDPSYFSVNTQNPLQDFMLSAPPTLPPIANTSMKSTDLVPPSSTDLAPSSTDLVPPNSTGLVPSSNIDTDLTPNTLNPFPSLSSESQFPELSENLPQFSAIPQNLPPNLHTLSQNHTIPQNHTLSQSNGSLRPSPRRATSFFQSQYGRKRGVDREMACGSETQVLFGGNFEEKQSDGFLTLQCTVPEGRERQVRFIFQHKNLPKNTTTVLKTCVCGSLDTEEGEILGESLDFSSFFGQKTVFECGICGLEFERQCCVGKHRKIYHGRVKKNGGFRFSDGQQKILNGIFNPKEDDKVKLAAMFNCDVEIVSNWFSNRRAQHRTNKDTTSQNHHNIKQAPTTTYSTLQNTRTIPNSTRTIQNSLGTKNCFSTTLQHEFDTFEEENNFLGEFERLENGNFFLNNSMYECDMEEF